MKTLQVGVDREVAASDKLCDSNENLDTRGDANGILDAVHSFTYFYFRTFWKVIFQESHEAQTSMQQKGLSLAQSCHKLKASVAFLTEK